MKALYRKYRPIKLDEVVGQEQITKPLSNSLREGKIGHAYLFVGPRGCGKTSVARIFAHEVNGFKYEIEDDYVDIIEIDGASNRGIDNIRELREKVTIAPTLGKYKVYIIDEVHMLTKEAFNALLKTLEEPPEHAIFIMATTDFYKVPVTIVSRAQTYTFKLAEPEVMFKHLKEIAEKEGIKIEDAALNVIVKRGGGSFRDSLSLLDQISTLSDEKITKDLVIAALGMPEEERVLTLLLAAASGDMMGVSNIMRELLTAGIKPETLAEEMIAQIIAKPEARFLPLLSKLPEVKAPFAEAKLLTALCLNVAAPGSAYAAASVVANKAPMTQALAPGSAPEATQAQVSTPVVAPAPAKPATSTAFDWETFIGRVEKLNNAISAQAKKCRYTFDGEVLTLFPDKNITKTILSRDGNKKILASAGEGVKITIGEVGDAPKDEAKDEVLSKISAIMGGEVKNDGSGGNPF